MNASTAKSQDRASKSAVPPLADWGAVNWLRVEKYVRKLQQRIHHAEVNGRSRKVRNLQRLLLRSRAALAMSVKRVTQENKGKRTAGVDGMKVLSPKARTKLYNTMKDQHISLHNPKPTKRTYIPKKNGKLRPLGIPTIKDRVWQNVAKLALEPQWEARFESTSYGFRPKRSIHDAATAIYLKLKGLDNKKLWVFEGDFKGCFDNLNHHFILEQIGAFPAKHAVSKWLGAGYIDNDVFHETQAGTPQGGIISPLLANIALHGMEDAIGVKYETRKPNKHHPEGFTKVKTPFSMVRYADDFVILCETEEEAKSMYGRLKPYLKKRGLELAEDKTKVTKVTDGFDFLGFTFRKWETRKLVVNKKTGKKEPKVYFKTIVKPSAKSVKKAREDIKDAFQSMRGSNVTSLINKLNPILRGKANVWRHVVSSKVLTSMDSYIVKKVFKFLRQLHPTKSVKWRSKKYFRPDVTGQSKSRWILSSPEPKFRFLQLFKMSWTEIARHELIKFKNTPFDKKLKAYYEGRDIKRFDAENVASRQKMAKRQGYKCPLCGTSLVNKDEGLETHHKKPKAHGGDDSYENICLVHISCHIEHHRKFPAQGAIPTQKELNKNRKMLRRMILQENSGKTETTDKDNR